MSAVVPVYNGARTLGRALDSIFAQDFRDVEVTVVDDGSTDHTAEILDSYGDRIRVIRQENRGSPAARNAGVAASRAEYIAFLDADDVWLPGRLAKTIAALDREPDAVLAYSDAVLVDYSDTPVGSQVPQDKAHPPSFEDLTKDWWPTLPSSWLIRRWAYQVCGGFCERFTGARGYADVFFFLRLREQGRFAYLPEQLVRYRRLPYIDRMKKYAPGFKLFGRCMRDRYGAAGDAAIRKMANFHYGVLKVTGLHAMAGGRLRDARRAFRCAMRYRRPGHREVLRLLRTYLPRPLAVALTNPKWASASVPE